MAEVKGRAKPGCAAALWRRLEELCLPLACAGVLSVYMLGLEGAALIAGGAAGLACGLTVTFAELARERRRG